MISKSPHAQMLINLEEIYATIPLINCQHCHICDGPIIWFRPEEINIRKYLQKHKQPYIVWSEEEFKHNNMKCPYLQKNQCSIYPVRPFICRLQGTIPDLPCKKNNKPILTKIQTQTILTNFKNFLIETNSFTTFFSTKKH